MRISNETARRFLLGRQGLWPGRRWRGIRGTAQAMRAMVNLQLDPLQIVARAQDLALHSRVIGYRQEDWARLTYEKRRFFEWGGWLAVRPIEELPYFRVLMRRSRTWGRMRDVEEAYGLGPAIEEMRRLLRQGRELTNRDFAMGTRARVDTYRSRKDSGLALHYLWRVGEAMVTRREHFERVYALAENVVPKRYMREAANAEADDFLLLKAVAANGFAKLNGANATLHRDITRAEVAAWKGRMVDEGLLVEVEVEGLIGRYVALASDAPILEVLEAGRVPRSWKPLETTTDDEVTFLSPLDPVVGDRERTRRLFDFHYKWEVYDKPEKRKFGYYVLPILWGARLVGRMDAKVDRVTSTLVILGTWYEGGVDSKQPELCAAIDRGLDRLRSLIAP